MSISAPPTGIPGAAAIVTVSPGIEPATLHRYLREKIRGEVYADRVSRGIYATDASHYQMMPVCVACPVDEADCVTAMKIASEHGVPIVPRGGGTSLSGQTFGVGLVLDLSNHMDRTLEVNIDERWARVQAGVVRDRLNAELSTHRLHFAPDPATSNRATVAGMIGNNASGMRSIVYGKTIDHTLGCRLVLADGEIVDCRAMEESAWREQAAANGSRRQRLMRSIAEIVDANREDILARYPDILRRVAGYNLDEFVPGAGYTGPIGPRNEAERNRWNLCDLVVGSEGTLGLVTEATIRLTPNPAATSLVIVHFEDDIASLAAVPEIVGYGSTAVELLDRVVLQEAVRNSATKHMATFVEGSPDAVLLVEFHADDASQAADKANQFVAGMKASGIGYAWPVRLDSKLQSDVWEVRKLGLGLISNTPGPVKGQAFVEDASVPVEVLAEYISRLRGECENRGVRSSMYAHASVGVIHFRPMLDLHREEDRRKMKAIADAAFEMVVGYGGAFSGEHGDGQVRGEYVRRFFGERLYRAFVDVKRLFDPAGLMNPGKIIEAPSMISHLRYGEQYRPGTIAANFHYREQGGFVAAVEQCNGVGACRKLDAGAMCPSYMATRDEEATTRGRANALRLAMSGQLGDDDLTSDRVHEVLSLCLSCKACKSECPNAVDMAKLKADALQMRYDRRGVPLAARLVGGLPALAKFASGWKAPMVNLANRVPGGGWLRQWMTGIDRRRSLPPFARRSLDTLLKKRNGQAANATTPKRRVVLFDDTFCRYMEPHIGVAAVELLEGCGYEVILANAGCCQRTRLSKGLVKKAKKDGAATMANLDRFAQEGLPIVCLEPSCATALVDDLPDLMDDAELGRRVAAQVSMIDVFLDEEVAAGRIAPLACEAPGVLLHGHCHQKAESGTQAIHRHFARLSESGATVPFAEVDSGCCGMAGAFGYEHHELSEHIGEDRLFPAVRLAHARGKTIMANGTSCRQQLKDFLGIEAKHFVEVMRAP